MSDHEVSVNHCISDRNWKSHENKHNKFDEFIGSADSVGFGIDPNHCQFVKDHFDVRKWPHYHFTCNKKSSGTNENWHVAYEQEFLVHRLRVFAC